MVQTYSRCPRLFKYLYIDGLKVEDSIQAQLGKIFHEAAQYFLEPIRKGEVNHIDCGIEQVNQWLDNFILFENSSPNDMLTPLATEVELSINEPFPLKGIIDRIDLYPTGYVRILEYKTSQKITLTDWRRELHFYKILYENSEDFYEYPVKTLAVYNPRLNIYFEEQPNKKSESALINKIYQIFSDKTFKMKKSVEDVCAGMCEFYDLCVRGV